MNRFHRLKNNESDFPLIGNVDVYKFDNDFDYQRFNATQMELQICTVPWDVGEAHVGQRTISGIGNVVWFESKANRNAWFDAIPDSECFRFTTKFKELHREMLIDVPIPYDICARHNYLRVKYNMFANDESPVQYEDPNGLREWFWFIREVEFVAPNTTRLHLLDDAFQTWMYDVTVSGMILERGHAPMFRTKTDDYLANPIQNNSHLLTEDVNFGQSSQVAHIDAHVFNAGDMYACIATSANPRGTWGTKAGNDWRVPASASYSNNGVPSVYVFAIESGDLSSFLSNVTSSYPQFKQTVQGIFLASAQLLDLGDSFTFAGTTCYSVSSTRKSFDLCNLQKSQFGYDALYADIAKLYTSPYAHIEITDETGNVDVIRIEDTTGNIGISAVLSLAYPFINIEAHLTGIGGTVSASITFRNLNNRTFPISGRWYDTLRTWNVPTFAVVLDPSHEYDYSTHFDRAQRIVDYNTAYNNTAASADANAENVATIAAAEKSNADASADTLVSNTALQTAANSAINARSNQAAATDADYANGLSQALQAWEAGYTRDTANNEIDAKYASAAIGAAGGAIGSAISGASSGASAGPVGAAAGAIGGLISGAVSGATTMAQTAVAANLTSAQAEATVAVSQNKVYETSGNNSDRTNNQISANTANTNASNKASTGASANSAATTKANATRARNAQNTAAANAQSTEKANAGRTRSQAQSAITNDIAQAALRSPFVYGSFADGDSAASKPMALFANIVTQSRAAIIAAGDEFLRYGYAYEKQWDFNGNWNVGKYFTYWKLSDFWVKNLNVPDMYMDKLRFFLFGGVTVWRRPEDIGNVTIYENFNG